MMAFPPSMKITPPSLAKLSLKVDPSMIVLSPKMKMVPPRAFPVTLLLLNSESEICVSGPNM